MSLKSQINNEFSRMFKYGSSKHEASAEERSKTIYSTSTRDTYKREGERFVKYLHANNLPARTKDEAEKYVPQYLQSKIDNGYSAWSIRVTASALGKLYQKPYNEFGVTLPSRNREDIIRGRTETEYSKHFSEVRHSDIVCFCKSTGLRRTELEKLRGSDIKKDEKGNYIIEPRPSSAKNGKDRTILLYNKDKAIMDKAIEVVERSIGRDERVFEKISKACNVHNYRADYAKSLYEKYARDVSTLDRKDCYQCYKADSDKIFDKQAVDKVTQALGHHRLNVTIQNYLLK